MTKLADQPAFARPDVWSENHGLIFGAYGMTLRQYYAGQALTGLLAGSPDADCGPEGYASDAVMMADALIAELEKGGAT